MKQLVAGSQRIKHLYGCDFAILSRHITSMYQHRHHFELTRWTDKEPRYSCQSRRLISYISLCSVFSPLLPLLKNGSSLGFTVSVKEAPTPCDIDTLALRQQGYPPIPPVDVTCPQVVGSFETHTSTPTITLRLHPLSFILFCFLDSASVYILSP